MSSARDELAQHWRDAQRVVAQTLPACAVVETRGLSLQSDGVHFDTAGVMALGEAFATVLDRARG